MKRNVSKQQFVEEFDKCDRGSNFTEAGREALFDYLEELGDDIGTEIELDVIAVCCEYSEYDSLEEFQEDYDADQYGTVREIEEVTTLIPIPGTEGFIIQQF